MTQSYEVLGFFSCIPTRVSCFNGRSEVEEEPFIGNELLRKVIFTAAPSIHLQATSNDFRSENIIGDVYFSIVYTLTLNYITINKLIIIDSL